MPRPQASWPQGAVLLPAAVMISLLAVFGAAIPVRAAAFAELTTDLAGDQVVPPTGSLATGKVDITVDTEEEAGSQLSYEMTVEGLSGPAIGAALHQGAVGTNSANSIVANLAVDDSGSAEQASVADGDFNLANAGVASIAALLEAISANPEDYFVTVSTSGFPDGEIRGQLAVEGADGGDEPSDEPEATDEHEATYEPESDVPDSDDVEAIDAHPAVAADALAIEKTSTGETDLPNTATDVPSSMAEWGEFAATVLGLVFVIVSLGTIAVAPRRSR